MYECFTFVKTLERALGMPRDTDPKVIYIARLRSGAKEESPSIAPRNESGRFCIVWNVT